MTRPTDLEMSQLLLTRQLDLVRAAGYPITSGLFATRTPTELRLLQLAGELATAIALEQQARAGAVPVTVYDATTGVDLVVDAALLTDHVTACRAVLTTAAGDAAAAPEPTAQERQFRELALVAAGQAQAIAENTVTGSRSGAVARLACNVTTLTAWSQPGADGAR